MTFLQTGVRVSELCALRLDDIDLIAKALHLRVGKGMTARTIELKKRGASLQVLAGGPAINARRSPVFESG